MLFKLKLSSPSWSRILDNLLVSSPDALLLSYKKPVAAQVHVSNILNTARWQVDDDMNVKMNFKLCD